MFKPPPSRLIPRTLSVVLTLLLLTACLRLWFAQDRDMGYLPFFPALMLATFYGGLGVGGISAVLATAVVSFFLPDGYSLLHGGGGTAATLWFALICAVIVGVTELLRRALGQDHLERAAPTLSADKLELLAKAFTGSSEGILICDARNRIMAVNLAFTRLTGYSEAEVLGKNPKILSAGRTRPETYQEMWTSLNQQGTWQGELWDRRKSGDIYPKWLSITVLKNQHQQITHYVGSFSDISQRKASEEAMVHLAHHDPLTHLPNRLCLQYRMDQAINFCSREKTQLALLLIDLDRFKSVNDTLGHHIGDQLLVEVSQRLTRMVRETDIVARLGGDEFVVVVTSMDSANDAAVVAAKIVRTISMPYLIHGQELRTSPSIGIAIFANDASEFDDLLKCADVAMYQAKDRGRGQYHFFAEVYQHAFDRQTMEVELRAALEQGQFVLHYQPQLSLLDGQVVGVEALVRWQHPERGLLLPKDFIDVAEDLGLSIRLGNWVLQEACRQMQAWRQAGAWPPRIAVNLGAKQFFDAELPAAISRALADHALDPECLELEVMESVAMSAPDDAVARLEGLARTGVSIAVEEFGNGYSSLAHLKRFSIQTVKINPSVIQIAEASASDIFSVMVLLAHSLEWKVIASGVETSGQKQHLTNIGCDKIQGYLISKPLPAAAMNEFLRDKPPAAVQD